MTSPPHSPDLGPRERMVRSAMALICVQGVSGTGMRQVVEHAGAPRGSLQHYFPQGKEQLVKEALALAGRAASRSARPRDGGSPARPSDVLATMVGAWRTWLASYGVFEIGEDMVPLFNSEQGVAATQFYKDLMDKYKVVPQAAKTWTWDEVTTAFGSGLTAIAMNYHRMLLDPAIEQKGGKAAFAMVPGQREADGSIRRAPHYGSYYLALNKYANHQPAAYKFIQWLASPEVQNSFAKYQFHSSRRDYYENSEVLSKWPEYWKPFEQSLEIGNSRPRLTVFRQYSETIQAEVSSALAGNKSVKQALDDAAREVIELFKQAGYYDALHVDPYAKQPQAKH